MTPYCTNCTHARTEPIEMLGQIIGERTVCLIGKRPGYCTEFVKEKTT